MYKIAHFLRDHVPFIWDFLDWLNGVFFSIRYGKRIKLLPRIVRSAAGDYKIEALSSFEASDLECFFSAQPEDSFKYFRPHGFDVRSLRKLQQNKAFLAYMVKDEDELVGYFFLRSFFFGKAYLGKMVDHAHRGKGIGKMMCLCAMDIATALGLRMYETISKDNPSSLYSSGKVLVTRIVEEMPDNYLMIEDIRKRDDVD